MEMWLWHTDKTDEADGAEVDGIGEVDKRLCDQPDVPGVRWRLLQSALVNTSTASGTQLLATPCLARAFPCCDRVGRTI